MSAKERLKTLCQCSSILRWRTSQLRLIGISALLGLVWYSKGRREGLQWRICGGTDTRICYCFQPQAKAFASQAKV